MHLFILTVMIFFPQLLEAQNNWQQVQGEMPPARKNHTMVEINGIIYLFGGESGAKSAKNTLNELWAYDEGNSTWSEVDAANPPEARKNHTAVALDGKMYVHGGTANGEVFSDMWVYDPNTNYWGKLETENPPPPKLYQKAVASEGQIFVTGGMDEASGEASAETWAFNPNYNTWTQKQDMPVPRYGHATFFKDLKVYVTVGRNESGLLNDTYVYDIPQDSWSGRASLPIPIKFPAFAFVNDIFFMAAGTVYDDFGNFVDNNTCWEYDFTQNTWTQKENSPVPFTFGAAAPLNDDKSAKNANQSRSAYKVMIFGGETEGVVVQNNWIYDSESGWNVVGMEEYQADKTVNVFPGITSGLVNIRANKKIEIVNVYDLQGRLVINKKPNASETTVDLSNTNPGTYIIHVYSNKSYVVNKVVLR